MAQKRKLNVDDHLGTIKELPSSKVKKNKKDMRSHKNKNSHCPRTTSHEPYSRGRTKFTFTFCSK